MRDVPNLRLRLELDNGRETFANASDLVPLYKLFDLDTSSDINETTLPVPVVPGEVFAFATEYERGGVVYVRFIR